MAYARENIVVVVKTAVEGGCVDAVVSLSCLRVESHNSAVSVCNA